MNSICGRTLPGSVACRKRGETAKTIRNNHSLIFASREKAVLLRYRPDNPCRGVELPSGAGLKMMLGF